MRGKNSLKVQGKGRAEKVETAYKRMVQMTETHNRGGGGGGGMRHDTVRKRLSESGVCLDCWLCPELCWSVNVGVERSSEVGSQPGRLAINPL